MIHIVQVCWSQLLTFFDHSFFSSTQSELFPVILVYCSVVKISPNPYHPFVKAVMCWNECENSLSAGEISVSRMHVCRSDVFSNVHDMYKSPCVLLSLLRKLTTFARWKNATVERHGHILYHFFWGRFSWNLHLLLLHCSSKLLTKICCKISLNFIRLLRVVITPSVAERRKRLEAIGWNSG